MALIFRNGRGMIVREPGDSDDDLCTRRTVAMLLTWVETLPD
jgi:hypothetical protein